MPYGISDISLSSDISGRDKLMNIIKHFFLRNKIGITKFLEKHMSF